MREPELTSLVGVRDADGDRLVFIRLDRANGTRGYVLRVGTGSVHLTTGDLYRLSTAIRRELAPARQIRFLVRAIWLAIFCALVGLLASSVTGPLFAYPWSN